MMKTRIFLSILMASLPFTGFAQMDDMYFVPQKEEPKKESTVVVTYRDDQPAAAEESVQENQPEANYATGELRDVDEYNRRGRWAEEDSYPDDSLSAADSTEVEAMGEGSGDDYACSKRILRFCTPTVGVAVSSPLYWDLCYGPNAIYWDVYDDGIYAYAFPSSWSAFYWGPYYSWGWGWNYYWGWGGPWYAGWYDPWYWRPYWHNYPHWGHPGPGIASRPLNRPSVRYREHSSLALGKARRNSRGVTSTRTTANRRNSSVRSRISDNDYQPARSTTTTRQPMRSTTTTTRTTTYTPSRSSSFTPSSRSSYRPTFSSPSRSGGGGGGFSPSRGGGGGGARGGRR